jgi:hemerythrin
MKNITAWKKNYEVGNPEIDAQHKTFLKIIEKLHNAYEKQLDDEIQLGYIMELHKYAAYHFISEENFMLIHKYPGYEEHKILHEDLLKELIDNITTYKIKYIDVEGLINFSLNWFIKHTTTIDKKIVEYILSSKNQ